jgi:hypothetical protein
MVELDRIKDLKNSLLQTVLTDPLVTKDMINTLVLNSLANLKKMTLIGEILFKTGTMPVQLNQHHCLVEDGEEMIKLLLKLLLLKLLLDGEMKMNLLLQRLMMNLLLPMLLLPQLQTLDLQNPLGMMKDLEK